MELTKEQAEKMAAAKAALVNQIMTSMDVPKGYKKMEDGRPDVDGGLVDIPVEKSDVVYLVDVYFMLRTAKNMSHGDAARITYSCLYRNQTGKYNPHTAISNIKNQFGDIN